jgi:formylglycine-generating enzyme required for sulfatase activity
MRYLAQIPMTWATGIALLVALAGGAAAEAQLRSEPAGTKIAQAQTPTETAAAPFRTFRDCSECPEMVELPAGRFMMGQADGDGDERPVHEVTIGRPFAIGKFEVTFDEWDACGADGGCEKNKKPYDEDTGRGRHPVVNISRQDATAYLQWLSRKTGKFYRLLSEAEWEYAARAGTTTKYSTGDTITKEQAKFASGTYREGGSEEVGKYPPNPWGLYDMHGNVWEWVEDCYETSYRGAPSNGSVRLLSQCPYGVVRGGSWDYSPDNLRSAARYKLRSNYRINDVGLRVARAMD